MNGKFGSTAEILDRFQDENEPTQLAVQDFMSAVNSENDGQTLEELSDEEAAQFKTDTIDDGNQFAKRRRIRHLLLNRRSRKARQEDEVLERLFFEKPLNRENLARARREASSIDADFEVISDK